MQGVPAEEAPAPSALPGELRAAVLALDHDAVAALIVQTEAWGVEAKALAVWAKMQATRKGKFPWNKQKPVREEGEEGEEEEPEEEEEDEEEEPFDFADEEWQAEITEEIFGGPLPGKFTVAKIVKLGVFEGEREPRPAEIDVPFDAMVTARQGYGVNLAPGGEVYAGEFGENVRSGHGAMLYPKQGLYVGFWKEGRRHGHGKMAYADGSTYEGAWAFGKRHGKGTFRYANGDSYVGSFFNGKKDGAGVYRAAAAETKFDGAFGGGQLLAGKALTPDGAYYGTFKKGAADGKGAWALPNGVVVEGVNAGKLPEDADEEDEEAKLEYSWQGGAISTAGTATDEVLRASLCIAKPKPKIVISGQLLELFRDCSPYSLWRVSCSPHFVNDGVHAEPKSATSGAAWSLLLSVGSGAGGRGAHCDRCSALRLPHERSPSPLAQGRPPEARAHSASTSRRSSAATTSRPATCSAPPPPTRRTRWASSPRRRWRRASSFPMSSSARCSSRSSRSPRCAAPRRARSAQPGRFCPGARPPCRSSRSRARALVVLPRLLATRVLECARVPGAGTGEGLAARWLPEDRRAGQGDGAHVHRAQQGARTATCRQCAALTKAATSHTLAMPADARSGGACTDAKASLSKPRPSSDRARTSSRRSRVHAGPCRLASRARR